MQRLMSHEGICSWLAHVRSSHQHAPEIQEYEVQSGNVFSGTCPDQTNHQWQFASQLALCLFLEEDSFG